MDSYEDFMKQYGGEFDIDQTKIHNQQPFEDTSQLEKYVRENEKLREKITKLEKTIKTIKTKEQVTVLKQVKALTHLKDANKGPNPLQHTTNLRSMAQICKVFGKGRETIKEWFEQGAPIAFDGFSYLAEYHTLMKWLIANSKRGK